MKDIFIAPDSHVVCRKQLWAENEIILAKCFGFDINAENGQITINPRVTAFKSIEYFMELAFRNFSESPLENNRKQSFYMQLQVIYNDLATEARAVMKAKLPYFDKLYIHQDETIVGAFYKKYNFLALDRRLGKTLISASISRVHNVRRTVIVCPATAKWNAWFRDLTKKFGFNELFFTILDSKKKYTIKAFNERFVLVNYDIIEKFEKELNSAEIGHFILDECHKIKNKTANRTKVIKKLVEAHPNARITFLSGTPITNRVNDVFSYLNLIGHELGQSYKKFCDEFTISQASRGGERVTGGRNLHDLHIKLSNFFIRKRKEDCIDVPKQTFTSYKFELDDYRTDYDQVIKELSEKKEISALTGNIHSLNIITSKAKMKGIIELAEEIIDNGEKVVIFSNYTEPLKMLQDHFKERCVLIDGSVESYKRDGVVERFMTDESVPVFLGNMASAGEAINLAIANEIIIVDFPLVPGTLYQAIDRCIEIGKKDGVNVNYTFCEDSVDEYIYSLIADKDGDISVVVDNGKESLVDQNITELLIKKLLNKEVREEFEFEGIPLIKREMNGNTFITTKEQSDFVKSFYNNLPDFE